MENYSGPLRRRREIIDNYNALLGQCDSVGIVFESTPRWPKVDEIIENDSGCLCRRREIIEN